MMKKKKKKMMMMRRRLGFGGSVACLPSHRHPTGAGFLFALPALDPFPFPRMRKTRMMRMRKILMIYHGESQFQDKGSRKSPMKDQVIVCACVGICVFVCCLMIMMRMARK